MKECYSAQAIKDMFFYAQAHFFVNLFLVMMSLVTFVYIFEWYKKRKPIKK